LSFRPDFSIACYRYNNPAKNAKSWTVRSVDATKISTFEPCAQNGGKTARFGVAIKSNFDYT
jgi:hypothetical protein